MSIDEKVAVKLSENLDKLHSRLDRDLNKYQTKVHKELKLELTEVYDLVSELADGDTIPVNKAGVAKRRLNEFEKKLRTTYEESITEIVTEVAESTYKEYEKVFGDEGLSEEEFVKRVVNSIMRTKMEDGLDMFDRFRRNALVIRQAIETVVIYRILSRGKISKLLREIASEFDSMKWTISRVVKSELFSANRRAVLETLKKLGDDYVVDFTDGMCGQPNHYEHSCYTLANEDRHGLGKGVFTSQDIDIIYPHPACTSKISIRKRDDVQ